MYVSYAHQLRHRHLRLGHIRRLHLLLDALRLCLGSLQAKQTTDQQQQKQQKHGEIYTAREVQGSS